MEMKGPSFGKIKATPMGVSMSGGCPARVRIESRVSNPYGDYYRRGVISENARLAQWHHLHGFIASTAVRTEQNPFTQHIWKSHAAPDACSLLHSTHT